VRVIRVDGFTLHVEPVLSSTRQPEAV
jgi:hypothetical protein